MSIMHAVITVSDMEDALAFYRDLLGLEVAIDHVHDPALLEPLLGITDADVRAVILECPDGSDVELVEFRHPRGNPKVTKRFEDAGVSFVTIVVDDIDAVVARLGDRGFAMTGPVVRHPFPSPVRVAYCLGPDGTAITLAEFLSESEHAA
jgi:catechol 2,3-dioxygenase-like lactoylglutathione lyase family enzyme